MFEAYTYDALLANVLANAPEDIDTRKGSIFYDAVSGILLKVAKLYTDLDTIVEMTCAATAKGAALDTRAGEYGVTRLSATSAKYYVNFEGAAPQTGERFFADGKYFILKSDPEAGAYYLEAEIAGTEGNEIYLGTPAVPVNNIPGLTAATFGALYESGTDAEDDERLRTRVQEKIAGPAENGNKQHYKTWCESRDGIGRARIFPLWNGPNTVKAVLIDSVGRPCSAPKVAEVQEYIDPTTKGYTVVVDDKTYVVGDGLGGGAANIGAHFTAVAAAALTVNISFTAELTSGATKEAATEEARDAIEEYFKTLVLDTEETEDIIVRASTIGAIISGLKNVLDYGDLKLNGAAKNIVPGEDDVPVIGEVQILYFILGSRIPAHLALGMVDKALPVSLFTENRFVFNNLKTSLAVHNRSAIVDGVMLDGEKILNGTWKLNSARHGIPFINFRTAVILPKNGNAYLSKAFDFSVYGLPNVLGLSVRPKFGISVCSQFSARSVDVGAKILFRNYGSRFQDAAETKIFGSVAPRKIDISGFAINNSFKVTAGAQFAVGVKQQGNFRQETSVVAGLSAKQPLGFSGSVVMDGRWALNGDFILNGARRLNQIYLREDL